MMIFVFAFPGAAGLDAYALYPLRAVYLLPVGGLLSLLRSRGTAQAAGGPSEPH